MKTKSVFQSKTMWVNIITIVIALGAHYGIVPDQMMGDQIAKGIIAISPVLNMFMRLITKDAVKIY